MTQFDLSPFDKPAIVIEKKKYANFTVREVTFEEVLAFRKEQERKDRELLAAAAARDIRINDFKTKVGGTDSPTLIHGRGEDATTWAQKLAYAKKKQDEYMKPDPAFVSTSKPYEITVEPPPKLSILQRIAAWLISVWKSANF